MKLQLLFLCCVSGIHCAKILMIFPFPSFNFYNLMFRLVKELANHNHKVTFVSPFANNDSEINYEFIFVGDLTERMKKVRIEHLSLMKKGTIGRTLYDFSLGLEMTELMLKSKQVQNLLNSSRRYDVVIIEQYFNEAIIGMGHHFNAPVIILSPVRLGFRSNHLIGAPAPSSYVLDTHSLETKLDTFWDKLHNFLVRNFLELVRSTIYLSKQNQLFKKYFKTEVNLDQVMYNVSLVLSNSHSTIHDAVPHLPAVKNIGGYHVETPNKLPEDLKNYLNTAKNGVILVSMGSGLRSKDLDPKMHKLFINVFSKLKQNVIWKFETELKNTPKNLKTFQWLPQQDVLAHPNIRAFITHGGVSSLIEAVYFGVPVVGIPCFADQENNLETAAKRGYAVKVLIKNITEDNLHEALQKVLNEPKYKQNALKMSRLMHDQPMKPIDSAIYWIEYVIRHRGAPYLRSASLDLKWYQREMVDIISFILVLVYVIFLIIRKLCALICKKKLKTVISDKKNK
nr:PREDICTED: UDP-glucuronosyltransferase 2A2-like [Tribolium castaneum]|eukprot:XP_015838840.1 PREDICTED: UDP-glucuronosyltransferase 2A2-like [Tribolium castaneum]